MFIGVEPPYKQPIPKSLLTITSFRKIYHHIIVGIEEFFYDDYQGPQKSMVTGRCFMPPIINSQFVCPTWYYRVVGSEINTIFYPIVTPEIKLTISIFPLSHEVGSRPIDVFQIKFVHSK